MISCENCRGIDITVKSGLRVRIYLCRTCGHSWHKWASPEGAAMKLSEAMAAGWQKVPQIRGDYQLRDNDGLVVNACALGAACFAADPQVHVDSWDDVASFFPQIEKHLEAEVPGRNDPFEGTLGELVVHLNDGTTLPPDEIVEFIREIGY
jgi:hypothetical protein